MSSIPVVTAAGQGALAGTPGAVPYIDTTGVRLASDPTHLSYNPTAHELSASAAGTTTGALTATATASAGVGVAARTTHTAGIPLKISAPTSQTADLLQARVNNVTKFSVQPAGGFTAPGLLYDGATAELDLTGPGTVQATFAATATGAAGLAVVATASGVGAQAVNATADDSGAFAVAGNSSAGTGVYGYGGGVGIQAETDANGTALLLTAPSGFTGTLLNAQVNGSTKFAVAPSGRPRFVSTPPSSAADTGTAGEIAWDSGFLYICTATDTWKRVAIATWP